MFPSHSAKIKDNSPELEQKTFPLELTGPDLNENAAVNELFTWYGWTPRMVIVAKFHTFPRLSLYDPITVACEPTRTNTRNVPM